MPPKSLLQSTVLRFLGQLWVRELDAATLSKLNQPGVRAAFEELGGSVPDNIDEASLETLATDYCQLLVGPTDQLTPVQSIWENQQFEGEAAASMKRYFQLLDGYQPPLSIVDHLGVQLDFAAQLVLAAEAEPKAREIVLQYASDHLQWSNDILDRIGEKAETDFYRSLARVTQQVCKLFEQNDDY